ncbi:MAG: MarR family transcriptional regulator [Alteromonadaceae bacterium]|nr:MAG: MarR family transcriptional regulator [Alteromonadaceae bacterium]
MNILKTQQLLERLASLLRSESRNLLLKYGLQPVQFEALQYLSLCNRYSDTPMAVTEYLGQTKGSISQTIKVLEKKGLLEKRADQKDKRVIHLVLTVDGQHLVRQMQPLPMLQRAGSCLGDEAVTVITASLKSLLGALQEVNDFKAFGQCALCQHNIKKDTGEYFCGLTKERLSVEDIALICREYEGVREKQV